MVLRDGCQLSSTAHPVVTVVRLVQGIPVELDVLEPITHTEQSMGIILGESPPINSDHDPRVREQVVRLLELLDILKPWVRALVVYLGR